MTVVSLAAEVKVIVDDLSPIDAVIEHVVETLELLIIESLRYAAFEIGKVPSLVSVLRVVAQPASPQTRAVRFGHPATENVRFAVPPEKPVICKICSSLKSRSAAVLELKLNASGE